jgi:hypothetical protein
MKLSTLSSPRRRLVAGAAATSLVAAAVVGGALAVTASGATPAAFSGLVLGVSTTETARTLGWYTTGLPTEAEEVQLSTDRTFATKTTVPATLALNTTAASTGSNGKAVLGDLKPSTTYFYRVAETGTTNVSRTYSFKTHAFGAGDFDFLFFGDPQIGASGDQVRDGDGWVDTLSVATTLNPDAELLVSGGDQVDSANTETQWDNFLRSDKLRSYPWVATIGNHDVGGSAYEQHFALPATVDRSDALYRTPATKTTTSGGDYWFTYRGLLFVDLNSNAYSTTNGSDPAHLAFVKKTIAEHGAGTTSTVLVYHHSIYSPADHANDADNAQRRADFTTAFSDLGVDLVLQGHDHSYSRSYVIKNGVKADKAEKPGATSVVTGPGGVVYVTSNSASGSKYYDLTEPDTTKNGGDYGPDPDFPAPDASGHVRHWANSVENQEHVRTFIKVQVRAGKFVVENVRAGQCDGPNAAVERGNVPWCGPDKGAAVAPAVGSVQDHVDIHLEAPTVPGTTPGTSKPTPPTGTVPPAGTGPLTGSKPRVKGKPVVGGKLRAAAGSWSPGATLRYTWFVDGKPVRGATHRTFRLRAGMVGDRVKVRVVGTLPSAGKVVRLSSATTVKP